ncbi:hypothetical protein FX987_02391 [Vreelandella titanicae]|uniref:Uncharacterized protein n=1 Tax=Vreelandella titanicae TaxID=664683 RepID=A0AAP9NN44_9GAMM|nr:hypothetical protein FX987_02391 [Halomonas titanicae]
MNNLYNELIQSGEYELAEIIFNKLKEDNDD